MKRNVTLSAEEDLIEAARRKAAAEHSTLNEQFRRWLVTYVGNRRRGRDYASLMQRLGSVDSGGAFTRDELNER